MHAQQEICKIKQEMTKTLQGKTHKRRLNHRGGNSEKGEKRIN